MPEYGSSEDFALYVQPVLEAGCASLDCHGNSGRPLRLYGLFGLRLDVALRGEAASADELAANMRSIAGLDPGAAQVEDHLLLLKPLERDAGGLHHIGGDLWASQSAAAYRCLHSWLREGSSDAASQTICMEAIE